MEFCNFVFQACRVMDFMGHGKSLKMKFMGKKSLKKQPFRGIKKEEDKQFYKKEKEPRNRFHPVETNTAHFDTVKYKRSVMENLKRLWKAWNFKSPKEYEPCYSQYIQLVTVCRATLI